MSELVVAIYRPPGGSISQFIDCLSAILSDECVCRCKVIVTGDLNIDISKDDDSSNDVMHFVNSMCSFNFLPVITKPTRFPTGDQHGSPSILDHIWCSKLTNVESGILLYDVTDHLPTFAIVNDLFLPDEALIKVEFRDKSLVNIGKFTCKCSELTFDLSSGDVNRNTNLFVETLDRIYCDSFPMKTKYISYKRLNKPWLTNGLLKSIKNKSVYYKKFKMNQISERFYKNYHNSLTKTIKYAKNMFFIRS